MLHEVHLAGEERAGYNPVEIAMGELMFPHSYGNIDG
jgi:hypothetical protein